MAGCCRMKYFSRSSSHLDHTCYRMLINTIFSSNNSTGSIVDEVKEEKKKKNRKPTRDDICEILKGMAGKQELVSKQIQKLAGDIVKEGKTLSFMAAGERIKALNLPQDPLEK